MLVNSDPGAAEGRTRTRKSIRPGMWTPGKEKPSVPSRREWKGAEDKTEAVTQASLATHWIPVTFLLAS